MPRVPSPSDLLMVCPDWFARSQEGSRTVRCGGFDLRIELRRVGIGTVGIRLDSQWFSRVGEELEAGDDTALDLGGLAGGEVFVVRYCNPNATKALHVGHLRNIAIGHTLASFLRKCGATVTTGMHVGDSGRSMGEAIAGYESFDHTQPQDDREKPDRRIGRYYAKYVEAMTQNGPMADGTDPKSGATREGIVWRDRAEEILVDLAMRRHSAVDTWRHVRDQVVAGQIATLERLGTRPQELLFESASRASVEEIGHELLVSRVATRLTDGAIVYRTGYPEYPQLVLTRSDGAPTQHLRFLGRWNTRRQPLEDAVTIQVIGDEWLPLALYGNTMCEQLPRASLPHPHVYLLHGMVTAGQTVVSSSAGVTQLIDDLLDWLQTHRRVTWLVGDHEQLDPGQAVRILALGLWIGRPVRKRLEIMRDDFLDAGRNAGLTMLKAWVKAWQPGYDGAASPCARHVDYRFLIAQTLLQREMAARCVGTLDTMPLVRYYVYLSRWFCQVRATPSLARVMRTILTYALETLGLAATVACERS